jgi:hypothetical protein
MRGRLEGWLLLPSTLVVSEVVGKMEGRLTSWSKKPLIFVLVVPRGAGVRKPGERRGEEAPETPEGI